MELQPGDLTGLWGALDGRLVYREVPKAACSALAQVLHHADHGRFFAGDIHDARAGVTRWPFALRPAPERFVFSAVRNPFARIVSAFQDKVCTDQRDGKPYRNTLRQVLRERYGVDLSGDRVRAFRRFLLFVRDVTLWRERFWFDRHWTPQVQHLRALPLHGLAYDHLFRIEAMTPGLAPVLAHIPADTRPADIPRFNPSGHLAGPLSAWFDDLSLHLMLEVYRWDFDLLGYDPTDPDAPAPAPPLDLHRINHRLADPHSPHWAPLDP
jgi:hypothetical protein